MKSPPISSDEALCIAQKALIPSLKSMSIHDNFEDCSPMVQYKLSSRKNEPCWFIHLSSRKMHGILCSSHLIVVSKETGEVLYNGSAHDEG